MAFDRCVLLYFKDHQHIMNLRIDPAVDGHRNTIVYEDQYVYTVSEFDPISIERIFEEWCCTNREPTPIGLESPYGTAWTTTKTTITESTFADAAPFSNRVFKILNEQKINP
jgi:primary-amine oxidase